MSATLTPAGLGPLDRVLRKLVARGRVSPDLALLLSDALREAMIETCALGLMEHSKALRVWLQRVEQEVPHVAS